MAEAVPVTVPVMLADASTRTLTREAVERTAEDDPSLVASTDDRAYVAVGEGRRYDALRLIARTLDVSEDLIRPQQALNALRALKFVVDGVATPSRDGREPPEPHAGALLDDETEDIKAEPDVDLPSDVEKLSPWRGQWVGIKAGEIVAGAVELRALLAQVEGMNVTVMFVPETDEDF